MKKLFKVLPIMLTLIIISTNVFAADIGLIDDILNPDKNSGVDKIDTEVRNIWATVVTVVQILSVGAVVYAGLRYMFASADTKADIKKSMGVLAIGAILVFCSTTILSFVSGVAKNVLTQ